MISPTSPLSFRTAEGRSGIHTAFISAEPIGSVAAMDFRFALRAPRNDNLDAEAA